MLRYGFCMVYSILMEFLHGVLCSTNSTVATVLHGDFCYIIHAGFANLLFCRTNIELNDKQIIFYIFKIQKSIYLICFGNLEFQDKKNMLCLWNISMLFIINIRKIVHKETIFLHNCSRCKVRRKMCVIMLITKKKVKMTHTHGVLYNQSCIVHNGTLERYFNSFKFIFLFVSTGEHSLHDKK